MTGVIISEIYPAGGLAAAGLDPESTYNVSYIILHNTGSTAVDLSSYALQYSGATDTAWTAETLSGSIPAYGYYLVQLGAAGVAGAALPLSPDFTSSIAADPDAGKFALTNTTDVLSGTASSGGAIVDFAGYGPTANAFEGASAAASAGPDQSLQRSASTTDAFDTNNNGADFVVDTPNVLNSTSAALNYAPSMTAVGTVNIAENSTAVANIATFDAEGETEGNGLSYELVASADSALFKIDSTTGALSFVTAPDFETPLGSAGNSYAVTVRVKDSGGAFSDQAITVNVTDVNEKASAINLINSTLSIAENSSNAANIKIGDIQIVDDKLGTNNITLSGPDSANFVLVGTTLFLKAGVLLDFEQKPSYSVVVNVDDPTIAGSPDISKTFTVAITDISPETVVGTKGNDVIFGGIGNDNLSGIDGNDFLNGGVGEDIMTGGLGNDIFIVDNLKDKTIELKNQGTDQVRSSVDWTLASNIENLILLTGAKNGTGNALNNFISGNADANTLKGLGGGDIIDGGDGDDIIIGGTGVDFGDYRSATKAVTVSLLTTKQQDTGGAGKDTLLQIENLAGSNFADTLTGTNAANAIYGFSGNDTITTLAGNDFVDGGLGDDTMDGGTGVDTLSYATLSAAVTVDLSVTTQQNTVGGGLDTLTGFENLLGGNGADTLTGTSGTNVIDGRFGADKIFGGGGTDYLYGGFGNDTLDGGTGKDKLYGGANDDTYIIVEKGDVIVELLNEGTDTVRSSISYSLGANVENLALQGSTALNGTGNGLNNTLTGNSAVNVLSGLGGSDTLDGGAGADRLIGGAGLDTLTGGADADTFVFNTTLNATTNRDLIKDFEVGVDKIALENAIFKTLGAAGALNPTAFVAEAGAVAHDANDHILYDTATGRLYYDADGSGAGAKIEFVQLTGNPVLTASDFLII